MSLRGQPTATASVAAVEACRDEPRRQRRGTACDPLYQPGVVPLDRYDRKQTLPVAHRSVRVRGRAPPRAAASSSTACAARAATPGKPDRRGRAAAQYALKFVSRAGGVIYDPAIKGVLFLPADLGGVPRSMVETCAAQRGDIGDLSVKDGWRANDIGPELFEDFDRAMCSSATYRVVFNSEPGPGEAPLEYIRDKVGNTLRGKTTYTLHTPDFHVVPGSGFPTDNLRIGACGGFELRLLEQVRHERGEPAQARDPRDHRGRQARARHRRRRARLQRGPAGGPSRA
jgi:hypothetical protein